MGELVQTLTVQREGGLCVCCLHCSSVCPMRWAPEPSTELALISTPVTKGRSRNSTVPVASGWPEFIPHKFTEHQLFVEGRIVGPCEGTTHEIDEIPAFMELIPYRER